VIIPGKYGPKGWEPGVPLPQTKNRYIDLLSNVDATLCRAGTLSTSILCRKTTPISFTDHLVRVGCFRPVGLLFADGGKRLYVTSDTTGEIVLLKRA